MVFIPRSDDFITEISRLYESAQDKRSVWVTFKKYVPSTPKPKSKQQIEKSLQGKKDAPQQPATTTSNNKQKKPILRPTQEGCLVRATDGKKKISTLITQKDLARFQGLIFSVFKDKFEKHLRKKNETQKPATAETKPATAHAKPQTTPQKTKHN